MDVATKIWRHLNRRNRRTMALSYAHALDAEAGEAVIAGAFASGSWVGRISSEPLVAASRRVPVGSWATVPLSIGRHFQPPVVRLEARRCGHSLRYSTQTQAGSQYFKARSHRPSHRRPSAVIYHAFAAKEPPRQHDGGRGGQRSGQTAMTRNSSRNRSQPRPVGLSQGSLVLDQEQARLANDPTARTSCSSRRSAAPPDVMRFRLPWPEFFPR